VSESRSALGSGGAMPPMHEVELNAADFISISISDLSSIAVLAKRQQGNCQLICGLIGSG
jgi:hypothetical protein